MRLSQLLVLWYPSPGPEREPGNDTGVWCPGQVDQHGDGVGSLLAGRGKERGDPALGLGAGVGAIPAPHLPVDDGGPDRLLALVVGGVDLFGGEEREQGVGLVGGGVCEGGGG